MKTFISFRGAVVQVNGFSDRNAELEQIKNVVINVDAILECILY